MKKWWPDVWRPIGLIAVGLAFIGVSVYVGVDLDWDLTVTMHLARSDSPAWLNVGLWLLLGIPTTLLGVLVLVGVTRAAWRARRRR